MNAHTHTHTHKHTHAACARVQDADVHDFLHISDSFAPVKVRNGEIL